MRPSILELSRRAGDANVGQTILRLARLAEAAHRAEAGVDGGTFAGLSHHTPRTACDGIPMEVAPGTRNGEGV